MIPLQPVINPAIPFVDQIVGGLQPGTIITILGAIPNSAKDFQINLACGPVIEPESSRSPIAFHFSPRFESRYAARNSFQDGWGPEESSSPSSDFPFVKGQPFELMILVEPKEYKLAVNGKHYISFAHRIPYLEVNTLQIMKDVEIRSITLFVHQGPYYEPTSGEAASASPETAEPIARQALYDLLVPFEQSVPGGMVPGRTIFISGRPTGNCNRFHVDFFFGGEYGRSGDIALHFNPRFYSRQVVRNSCIADGWGDEETDSYFFPFEPNATFDLKITCDPQQFVIFVNGQHFCDYRHRLAYSQANNVRVEGDVVISSLIFE